MGNLIFRAHLSVTLLVVPNMTREKFAAELLSYISRRGVKTLRANSDETLTAAIITEQGGKENHREREQDCCSFCNQFT